MEEESIYFLFSCFAFGQGFFDSFNVPFDETIGMLYFSDEKV